jgi:hypothetical protein
MKVALLTAGYVFSAAHKFVTDLGANIVARAALSGKTVTNGVADASDITFTALTGLACVYIGIYQDTGVDATSRLVLYDDTITGFPLTPSGADVTVQWDNGANKIFKL